MKSIPGIYATGPHESAVNYGLCPFRLSLPSSQMKISHGSVVKCG